MSRSASSAVWAVSIVALSLTAAYVFDKAGEQSVARAFLVPVFPALLAVIAVAGGPHAASGEPWLMVWIGVVAAILWWGAIDGSRLGLRRLRKRGEFADDTHRHRPN